MWQRLGPMSVDRALPWVLRALWATIPVAAGGALGDHIHGWEPATRSAASALLWAGWTLVAVATVVPLPLGLTITRVGAAAAAAVCVWAPTPAAVVAVAALAAAVRPEVTEWYINGPAYPNERRLALRVPAALLLGPLWLAGAVVVGVPTAAVLLAAERQWPAATAVLILGGAAAAVAARALHGLARRWVVFVPAGVVLHDPLSIADPVLFRREVIESLHAAPPGSDSLDLTRGAPGLVLELVLLEKVPLVLRQGRREEAGASARLLFAPTRPGRVLAEAASRRVPTIGPEPGP